MEWNHLRYFYEVARAKSFTSASRHLRISQPSLSKAVALLEESQGVLLLNRHQKGVDLTELGKTVFKDCEKIFIHLDSIKNKCERSHGAIEGPFFFACSDHIAQYLIPKTIMKLQTDYPGLKPRLFVASPPEMTQKLLNRQVEFSLSFNLSEHSDLEHFQLKSFDLVKVASKKNLYEKKSLNVASISNEYSLNPSQIYEDEIEKSNFDFESNSQELQKKLCLLGAGKCILMRFMIEDELKKGMLNSFPLAKKNSKSYLHFTKRKDFQLSRAAEELLKYFQV